MAQRVDDDVSYHIHLLQFSTFATDNAARSGSSGEKQVRKPVDDQSVHFLGHGEVKGTGAGNEMCKPYSSFLAYYGYCHC